MTYQVFFGHLKARDIINLIEQPEAARARIEGNTHFFSRLEDSILTEGFRNPILVTAGYCPEGFKVRLPTSMRDDPSAMLVCYRLGGSRLYIAQKHDMVLPCIISDFTGKYADLERLETIEHIAAKFTDHPKWVTFQEDGVYTSMLDHYHMRKQ